MNFKIHPLSSYFEANQTNLDYAMQNKKLDLYSREIWSLCWSLDGLPLKKLKNKIKKYSNQESILWIKLFTQIRVLRKYSKANLLKKLDNPNPKELRIAERTLIKNIRIALNSKPLASPRSMVALLLKSAEEFYLRGFPHLAKREISKAHKICNAFEMLEEQHAVLEWALKIAMDLENWSEVEQIFGFNQMLLKKSTELNGFKHLLFDYWQVEVSARPKSERHSEVPENPGLSIRAKLHYLLLLGTGFIENNSNTDKQKSLEDALQLLENHPNIRLSNPTLSIEIFRRWTQFSLEHSLFEKQVEWLEKIKSITFLSPSQNIRLGELRLLWKLEIDLKTMSKDLGDSALKVKELLTLKKRSEWTRRHHEMAIALVKYNLTNRTNKEVLGLLSQLMESAKTTGIGKKYLLEAKQLEIELHQILGNLDLVQNKKLNLSKLKK